VESDAKGQRTKRNGLGLKILGKAEADITAPEQGAAPEPI